MKVALYLTDNKNPHDGVTKVLQETLKAFAKTGLSEKTEITGGVLLLRKERRGARRAAIEADFRETMPGVKIRYKNTAYPKKILAPAEYLLPMNYKKIFGEKADVYIFPLNYCPANKPKGLTAVIIHDLTPLHAPKNGLKAAVKRWLHKKMYKNAVKNADVIFTVSRHSESEILSYYPMAKGKTVVNYCGTDAAFFAEPSPKEKCAEVKEKYNTGEKYFLFVGQDRENKNLVRLLNAYALLPEEIRKNHKLVIANHNRELKEQAEKLALPGVVLLNGIENDDIAAVVQCAGALMLVSTFEGFGLPLVEAMAAGVPAITSNVSCLPEVAGGAALLADPYSEKSIAEAMERVITDEALREELIEKGRARAKDFTWENTAKTFAKEIGKRLCK